MTLDDEEVVQQVLQEKRTILNPPTLNYQQGQVSWIAEESQKNPKRIIKNLERISKESLKNLERISKES